MLLSLLSKFLDVFYLIIVWRFEDSKGLCSVMHLNIVPTSLN